MTRNLRTQLADLAEQYLRLGRAHVSRERAAELLADWPLAQPWDDETMALVLDRFAPAEPPAVEGLDFLPAARVDLSLLDPMEQIRAKGCDADAPGVYMGHDDTYSCRCMVCGRCEKHTGNSNQGHYWKWCSVTGSMREFHFCCPGKCELEAGPLVEVVPQPNVEAAS